MTAMSATMVSELRDFQEVAHSGGETYFDVSSDEEGRILVASGWTHSRPVPAAVVGLYASTVTGEVVADAQLGGLGQPVEPPPPAHAILVFLASDSQQRWGHQCPRCDGYFRSGDYPVLYPLTCTYCGLRRPAHHFLTAAQRLYVSYIVDELLKCIDGISAGRKDRVVVSMDAAADSASSGKTPDFYYAEVNPQTQFNCNKCGGFNDIRGRYSYCCSCGWRNNKDSIRDQLERLRSDLKEGRVEQHDAVRRAVSIYDSCCRDLAAQVANRIPMKPGRKDSLNRSFYDLDGAIISVLRAIAEIDLTKGVSEKDQAFLRLMMHRRHIFEHLGGVADKRYVLQSGDVDVPVGTIVREQDENVHRLIGLLNRLVANYQEDFHEIFPVTNWPIEYYERTKQWQRGG